MLSYSWIIIVNCKKKQIASLDGYVAVYDSYKHHSKYPFDNYRINYFRRETIVLWYSILPHVHNKYIVKKIRFRFAN